MKKTKLFSVLLILIVSLCFIGCASTASSEVAQEPAEIQEIATEAITAESSYELVGYSYKFALNGDEITFNFIDWYSDAEVSEMAESLKALVPGAVSAENTTYGEIVIKSSQNLTQAEFDSFVEEVKGIIYNQFFA